MLFLLHATSFWCLTVENVSRKWYPEITHHVPGVPIILVGTTGLEKLHSSYSKAKNVNVPPITRKEAEEKAREIHAYSYLEADMGSAGDVRQIFVNAVRACCTPQDKHKKKESCSLQ